MDTITLTVTGMTCGGCEHAVKRALARLAGVGEVAASHVEERVVVTFDPQAASPDAIRSKIEALGYTVAG